MELLLEFALDLFADDFLATGFGEGEGAVGAAALLVEYDGAVFRQDDVGTSVAGKCADIEPVAVDPAPQPAPYRLFGTGVLRADPAAEAAVSLLGGAADREETFDPARSLTAACGLQSPQQTAFPFKPRKESVT